jgi:hypothetical protein
MANASQLLWSGEHWIAYLREHGRDTNSASIGIYHTRYSPAGEGSAALIDVPGDDGFQAIITDNREVLAFTMERVRAAPPDDPFNDLDLPVLDGTLARGGDVRNDPYWTLDADDVSIVVRWSGLIVPFLMAGGAPNKRGTAVAFSVLMFAEQGAIMVNGVRAPGDPYVREGWRRVTGPDGPASSFCFALAETYTTQPPG